MADLRPLCKGRHDIQVYGWVGTYELQCSRCPLRVTHADLAMHRNEQVAIEYAEREFAIRELES